jgi:predicted PurR-regulated permease PerM
VIGGTIAYGLIGMFLGPIVLSMAWELIGAWVQKRHRKPEREAFDNGK